MNINYKQPQFELFPANSATLEDINKPKFLLANLTFSTESLVIFAILAIMVALFSFSLGVERGKNLAAQALDERVSAAWNVGARTVALHQAPTLPFKRVVLEPKLVHARNQVIRNRYTLQSATYANEQYARRDAIFLKTKGFQSFLIKSGRFWILCTGEFANKEAASVLLRKLPVQFRSSQIRRF